MTNQPVSSVVAPVTEQRERERELCAERLPLVEAKVCGAATPAELARLEAIDAELDEIDMVRMAPALAEYERRIAANESLAASIQTTILRANRQQKREARRG